ncbi:MAG: putative protein involved in formation of curli polymer [Solidesulfovibrio magneticus str. Maddingley MBC34]|uniref:FlgO domain-containing protein n=1 Tax=Solidesulfovibrio magneticus str. Maddingley MBC34 TaxID=1206767 RepID=K6FMF3_9BACT|nr:MAG: putative protein involved in formation of curli polymer [Solidesulfovibrio magneticus str. Maddingley MBC34]
MAVMSHHTHALFVYFIIFVQIVTTTLPGYTLTTEGNSPVKIAILQFDSLSSEGKDSTKGRIISEFMTTCAVNTGAYDVVERTLVQKLLEEMEFGESGKSSTTVAQKIGQLSGATYVISGSLTEHKEAIRIDARLIRVSDGKIEIAQGSFSKNDLENLFNACKFITDHITEMFIQNIDQTVTGQTCWVSPEAMLVDKDEKLWLNPNFGIKTTRSPSNCMQLKRTNKGFEVNVTGCSTKWSKNNDLETTKYHSVTKIIY